MLQFGYLILLIPRRKSMNKLKLITISLCSILILSGCTSLKKNEEIQFQNQISHSEHFKKLRLTEVVAGKTKEDVYTNNEYIKGTFINDKFKAEDAYLRLYLYDDRASINIMKHDLINHSESYKYTELYLRNEKGEKVKIKLSNETVLNSPLLYGNQYDKLKLFLNHSQKINMHVEAYRHLSDTSEETPDRYNFILKI
jgi:hypothetical protein